jgi:translation initiation factor 4G
LFEVQRYCCNANWPQGLAKKLFYQLYDQDIVFEEAYNVWREDSDDTTDGKPKALYQVNEFLQWLETPGAGEEEEEDES